MQANYSFRFFPNWVTDIIGLMLVLFLFYSFFLGEYPLFTPDEGRYSEVAREMVVTGDYITPRVNGVAFLDKPILYYWLQAAAIQLFGLKEWALRFFPASLGALGCLMTYVCGRRLFDRRTGLFAALILATSPLYFGGSHYANLDLEVAVFISCTLLCLITGIQSQGKTRTIFLFSAYFFSALAMLTKGLIGVAFPGLIAFCWMIMQRRLALLTQIYLIPGILLFIAIVLPWYVLVQQANPEFLHFFFVTQQVTRFLSGAEFNNKTPFWFYAPIILGGFFPWTLFLIQAIKKQIQAQHPVGWYLLLWIGIITLFFSIPHSKLIGYILPIFPALALLTGNFLSDASRHSKKMLSIFIVCLTLSTVGLMVLVMSASTLNRNTAKPLTTQLQAILKPNDEVVNYFKFYQDMPIYLERRITLVANWHSPAIPQTDNWVRELWYGMAFQNTSEWLIEEKEFWQRWESKKRLFVFVNDNYLHQFLSHTHHYVKLGQHNDIILLSNQT